jgi:hypothetical protein
MRSTYHFFNRGANMTVTFFLRVASQYTSPNCHEPIYLLPDARPSGLIDDAVTCHMVGESILIVLQGMCVMVTRNYG